MDSQKKVLNVKGLAIYICLIDFMVSSIQKPRKRKLSNFKMKTMVNFCKGCDVHMFFCWRKYRGCVIYSTNIKQYDRTVSVTAVITRHMATFAGIYKM